MFFAPVSLSYLAIAALAIIPFWRIFEKAGFSPLLSLLMLVPVVNLIVLYYIAFTDWRR